MIESFPFPAPYLPSQEPRELALLTIISQSFFQPFSIDDHLVMILTALTSGSGIGFNRAMLFRVYGDQLKGEAWLGPRSDEEAKSIWDVLTTPGLSYIDIIEHNRRLLRRRDASLSQKAKPLSYSLAKDYPTIPTASAARQEMLLVRNAGEEPQIDPELRAVLGVEEFLCVPLLAQNSVMGLIILDNAFTKRPIVVKDIELASLCGLMAGNYIYTTELHHHMIEMERLAALGEMEMFITHQLRNPLTTIGGFAEQLLMDRIGEDKKRRNVEIIRNEIRRLEDMVTTLARFLRADIGEAGLFDLKTEILQVIRNPGLQQKSAGIEIFVDIEERLPLILGDRIAIGEALRNLIDNALEAAQGGRVTISGRAEDRNGVIVVVHDTGEGMPQAVKEKLFTPFFTTKDKGLGLGLLFVKRIMEASGGKIEVDSEFGRGTSFRLVFENVQERNPDA